MNPLDPQKIRDMVKEELERQLKAQKAEMLPPPPAPAGAAGTAPPSASSPDGHKKILVILTASPYCVDEVFVQLTALQAHARLTIVPTPGFLRLLEREELSRRLPGVPIITEIHPRDIDTFLGEHSVVLIPLLSATTLGRVVLGLSDGIAPMLIIQALLHDKTIIALREGILKEVDKESAQSSPKETTSENEPPVWSGVYTAHAALEVGIPHKHPATHISGLFKSYLRTLEQWGVRFVECEKLAEETQQALFPETPPPKPISATERAPGRRQVITRDDLWELKRQGITEMHVPENAIITDVAREYAHDNSINIITE